jgi:hypothetical protein
MKITRTIKSARNAHDTFLYLSDFTTTTEWDPGTVVTRLVSGEGGVGTIYANTSKFMGRVTQLEYVVMKYELDSLIQLRGENKTVVGTDTISIRATANGCEVNYTAEFQFHGLLRLIAPLLAPAFKKLGDEAEVGMTKALG